MDWSRCPIGPSQLVTLKTHGNKPQNDPHLTTLFMQKKKIVLIAISRNKHTCHNTTIFKLKTQLHIKRFLTTDTTNMTVLQVARQRKDTPKAAGKVTGRREPFCCTGVPASGLGLISVLHMNWQARLGVARCMSVPISTMCELATSLALATCQISQLSSTTPQ